jgi:hypothetical protein
MDLLRRGGLVVGDNEPYSVTDASDYTIPVHGEQRQLPHVAIEIRQDLIADEAGQRHWAALLVRLLPRAYERLPTITPAEKEATVQMSGRSAPLRFGMKFRSERFCSDVARSTRPSQLSAVFHWFGSWSGVGSKPPLRGQCRQSTSRTKSIISPTGPFGVRFGAS